MNGISSVICSLILLIGAAQAADPPDAPAPTPAPPAPPDASGRAQIEQQMQYAQEQMERAAREMAELGRRLGDQAWTQMPQGSDFGMSRVMLGIHIDDDRGSERAAMDGVKILSVSPGGPADTAGLKPNDVITSLAGKSVHDPAKGSAQHQFLDLIREVKPDVPVAVEFRRDATLRTVQVVPKSLSAFMTDSMSREFQGMRDGFRDHPPSMGMGHGDPSAFGSAELAELSPGLGHYFGTDKGLLVVRAPKDDRLKLQDGDVILDIDGRVPTGVSHAYQILSSYRTGETLKLHVMRLQKRVELTVNIPAEGDHRMEPPHDMRGPHPDGARPDGPPHGDGSPGPERRTEL